MKETIILNQESVSVQHLIQKDKRLAKLISLVGDIKYSPQSDGHSFLVHEIIEQMLSIKAWNQIYERLLSICNGNITPESINELSVSDIKGAGTSTAKAEYIKLLTTSVMNQVLDLQKLHELDDSSVINEFTKLRGIGAWTAKMYLIFVLNRSNVLPYEDGAFLQTYKWLYKTTDCSTKSIKARCKKWAPYASIAARYFYKALNYGLTQKRISPI